MGNDIEVNEFELMTHRVKLMDIVRKCHFTTDNPVDNKSR
jgi:hypothetical protein